MSAVSIRKGPRLIEYMKKEEQKPRSLQNKGASEDVDLGSVMGGGSAARELVCVHGAWLSRVEAGHDG